MPKSLPTPEMYVTNIRYSGILFPSFFIIVLSIVSYFVFTNGYERVKAQNEQLKTEKSNEVVLKEKLDALSETRYSLGSYVDVLSLALPDKNPILVLISQFKNLRNEFIDVEFSQFKLGQGGSLSGLAGGVAFDFGISGERNRVNEFIDRTLNIAPLTMMYEIKLNFSSDILTADVNESSFFAPYPKELPGIREPINKITQEDIKLITEVSSLVRPLFSITTPSGPFDRESPFGI